MFRLRIIKNNVIHTELYCQTQQEHLDWYSLNLNNLPMGHSKNILELSESQLHNSNNAIKFLQETDYKVLRHLRQKALNLATTLSETEYLDLEQQRHNESLKVL